MLGFCTGASADDAGPLCSSGPRNAGMSVGSDPKVGKGSDLCTDLKLDAGFNPG